MSEAERCQEAARLREEGRSLRAIGEKLGVSHVQIKKDLATVNDLETPERITGLDGRSRPSTVNRPEPTVNQPIAPAWKPREGARCAKCGSAPPGPGGILCPDCRADIEDRNRGNVKPPGDQPGGDGGDARPVGRSALSPGTEKSVAPGSRG
jgi:hypothetical protein